MNCKHCGQEAGKKANGKDKTFCNPECFKSWFNKIGQREVDFERHTITKAEQQFRQIIFQTAKEGNPEAREIMKKRYNITAFWDGKELVKL